MTNFKIPLLAWKLMRSPIKSQREEHYKMDDPVSPTNKLQGGRKREGEGRRKKKVRREPLD